MLSAANATLVMFADPKVLDRARVGLRQRLRLAAPAGPGPAPTARVP
jgi:hypothetical protein